MNHALILMSGLLLFSASLSAAELEGGWTLTIDTPRGVQHPLLTINRSGDAYSGTYEGRRGAMAIETISVEGDSFEFPLTISIPIGDVEVRYSGTIDGDAMTGKVANPRGEVPFTGSRNPQ